MKAIFTSLILTIALSIISSANASIKTKTFTRNMYASAEMDRYLSVQDLLIGGALNEICPAGVNKVLRVDASVEANFQMNGIDSAARTNPKVTHTITVDCK